MTPTHTATITKLTRAIKRDPQNADAYFDRGCLYYQKQNYTAALADFTRVIELAPSDRSAYLNRGITYCNLHNYAAALADFEYVLTLEPEDIDAYFMRGVTWHSLQGYGPALDDYARVIQRDPEHTGAYYGIACIFALQGHPSVACIALEKAITLDEDLRHDARTDPDFNPVRHAPCFQALTSPAE